MGSVKIEVLKDKKGYRLKQIDVAEDGAENVRTSPYIKPNELEMRLWEMSRFNRVVHREQNEKFLEEQSKSDELFESMVEELLKVVDVKTFKEYVDKKGVEFLEGTWKYKIDGLGTKKEQTGSLVVSEGVISGIKDLKLRGKVVEVLAIDYKVEGLFGETFILSLVKEIQENAVNYVLRGCLKDGREVELKRR